MCSKLAGGAVAYASATQTLYACVAGQWTKIAAPSGPPGQPGKSGSLVVVTPEPAGDNCPSGGQRIETGVDTDGNGALAGGEIASTQYVCNGAMGAQGTQGPAGAPALVAPTPEPAGTNCPYGGVKVTFGGDTNGNGSLDAGEVMATSYVCNGAPGTNAPALCGNGVINPGEQCDDGNTITEIFCPRGVPECTGCSGDCTQVLHLTASCAGAADCPVGSACDPVSHTCTTACSAATPCNGGCCTSDGTCAVGTTSSACGLGGVCVNCTVTAVGGACISAHCGCNTTADCPLNTACNPVTHICSS